MAYAIHNYPIACPTPSISLSPSLILTEVEMKQVAQQEAERTQFIVEVVSDFIEGILKYMYSILVRTYTCIIFIIKKCMMHVTHDTCQSVYRVHVHVFQLD